MTLHETDLSYAWQPLVKNKLFFFTDYEGFRQLQRYLNFDSLPTTTDSAGILPVSVVNPLTGVVYSANTQLPVASLNPFAAALLGGIPATNVSGAGRSNNYEALLLIRDYSDKFDAKLDGHLSDRVATFARWPNAKISSSTSRHFPDPPAATGTDIFTRSINPLRSAIPCALVKFAI